MPPVSPITLSVTPNIVPEAQVAQAELSKPIHSKKKKIALVVSLLVLLGLAGGAAAYAYYTGAFVTLPGLLSGYTSRAQALKSFKIDMNLGLDFSEMESAADRLSSVPFINTNATKLNLGLSASYDASDRNDMKFSSVISAALGVLSLQAEMRALDGIVYAKLTKVPVLPMPILETYKDKWFSAPYQSLNNKNFASEFTAEEKDYLDKMFQNSGILTGFTKLASETIAGEPSYHFSFGLDKEAFVSYIQSYRSYIESIGKTDSRLATFNAETFRKALDQVKDFKGEIWIGRNDKLARKIAVNFGVTPDEGGREQVKVALTAVVSDYNQPVFIVAPEESSPLQTIISTETPVGLPVDAR